MIILFYKKDKDYCVSPHTKNYSFGKDNQPRRQPRTSSVASRHALAQGARASFVSSCRGSARLSCTSCHPFPACDARALFWRPYVIHLALMPHLNDPRKPRIVPFASHKHLHAVTHLHFCRSARRIVPRKSVLSRTYPNRHRATRNPRDSDAPVPLCKYIYICSILYILYLYSSL